MPRRLKPEQQLELDTLYRVISVITEWYDELASEQVRGLMTKALRETYDERNLRGLRMAYNDLVEMTKAADTAQRRDLDARLRDRANTSLEALHAKTIQRIDRLRARGKLTSEVQYYLVREHVEFITATPGREAEAQHLWAMLQDFEERSVTRRTKAPDRKMMDDG